MFRLPTLLITLYRKLKFVNKPLTINRPRLILCLLVSQLGLLSACSSRSANAYSYSIEPSVAHDSTSTAHATQAMGINILSSFVIKPKAHSGLPVTELSDLAWDNDEQRLYAISDEGYLYHLALKISEQSIQDVTITHAIQLTDKKQQALKGKYSDAEGLSVVNGNNGIKGDSELIISFENKPRIAKYTPNGAFKQNIKTVKKLRKRKFYRGNNKALESVMVHPYHGVLTAAELPLKAKPKNKQTLYSVHGREWHFDAADANNSSVTALELISKDKVLILERAYSGLLSPVVISLRELFLNQCDTKYRCKTKLLAKLDSSEGWALDNFEGLTHLRGNQFLMVSDNNNNPLQKTILVLFEIPHP